MDKVYIFGAIILIIIVVFVVVLKRVFDLDKESKREIDDSLKSMGANRDERLLKLFQNIENMMDGFEEYISATRTEIEEQRNACGAQVAECTRMLQKAQQSMSKLEKMEDNLKKMAKTPEVAPIPHVGVDLTTPERLPDKVNDIIEKLHKAPTIAPSVQEPVARHVPEPPTLPVAPMIPPAPPAPPARAIPPTPRPASPVGASKHQKVKVLVEQGLNAEQIARELSIGKGEVQLIMGLFK